MKEVKYYGIHACQALAKHRSQDIIRLYLDESNVKTFASLLKWCASQKKAYHIIPKQELDRVSDSIHHEGICILAKEKKPLSEHAFRKAVPQGCLLYLDGVQNPHNLGSILRTAAHFGIPYILGDKLPSLSPSCCRIAKGAVELLSLVSLTKPLDTLRWLKEQGFAILATSSHRGQSLYQYNFPKKSIIAIGAESEGLGKATERLATESLCIPGTGNVESLNVAVATALCLGEYSRQHPQ
ncbi:MAG: tRNA/rRNA methyltransferase [Chlamydiia bacterium]|nr:tRNA/rRNA methyltransferase [Chlamydiia bacterium]